MRKAYREILENERNFRNIQKKYYNRDHHIVRSFNENS